MHCCKYFNDLDCVALKKTIQRRYIRTCEPFTRSCPSILKMFSKASDNVEKFFLCQLKQGQWRLPTDPNTFEFELFLECSWINNVSYDGYHRSLVVSVPLQYLSFYCSTLTDKHGNFLFLQLTSDLKVFCLQLQIQSLMKQLRLCTEVPFIK